MFVKEVLSKPTCVDGRIFTDRTIDSKFKKGDVSICTIYMDGKPILKKYVFNGQTILKHVWKTVQTGHVSEQLENKNLNLVV